MHGTIRGLLIPRLDGFIFWPKLALRGGLLLECSAAQAYGPDQARQSVARLANRRAHSLMERRSDLTVLWFVRRAVGTTVQ